jgi:hypothetical protein
VARDAALDFYRFVLEYEWTGFVCVALEADRVLRRGGAQLPREETAVRIVAVIALHKSFIHAVMERPVELLLGFKVAPVAELRLLFLHQELAFLRVMRRVAIDATHVILHVCGSREVAVLFAIGVADKAPPTDLLCGSILEREDLRLVATSFDVRLPGPMAGFAAVPFRTILRIEGSLRKPYRIPSKASPHDTSYTFQSQRTRRHRLRLATSWLAVPRPEFLLRRRERR